MANVFGGVETGGTWCVCAIGTGPDDLKAIERFPTSSPSETLERIVGFFRSAGVPAAVGIGAFGPVDLLPESPTWGYVTTTPKLGWQQVSVAEVVRDELQVPVAFDTDVNAAALAEYRWGAGRGSSSLCYLTVGTGIGAGFVIDARPVHGLVHPEAGHMRIPHETSQDPFPGSCPSHGDCWEGLASGSAMAARWKMAPRDLPDNHPAWSLEAHYLALGIANIICVASPARVIAGGGVMRRAGVLPVVRANVRRLLAGYLASPMLAGAIDSYLAEPELGDRAGVLGGIALAEMTANRS
jgi:fructokinase